MPHTTNKRMKTLTLDTNLSIDVRDRRPGYERILKILEWHKRDKVQIVVSNRLFEPDSSRMNAESLKLIHGILDEYSISRITPSVFRGGVSTLDGQDVLDGGSTHRTRAELDLFEQIAGRDPANRTRRVRQHIGDYDALCGHFSSRRDYFLTRDDKNVFSLEKRDRYLKELGLHIMSPKEFVDAFESEQDA